VNQVGPSGTAHGSSELVKAHTARRGRPSCRNRLSRLDAPAEPDRFREVCVEANRLGQHHRCWGGQSAFRRALWASGRALTATLHDMELRRAFPVKERVVSGPPGLCRREVWSELPRTGPETTIAARSDSLCGLGPLKLPDCNSGFFLLICNDSRAMHVACTVRLKFT
jgi:hypothetical protein